MANIEIQRKQGPGMWPWLIGALALVLVIWAVFEFTGDRTGTGTAAPAAEEAVEGDPAQPQDGGAGAYPPTGPMAPDVEVTPNEPIPGTDRSDDDPGTTGTTGVTGTTDTGAAGSRPGAQA